MRIGTRGSRLALAQARAVAALIEDAELVEIVTAGDRDRSRGDKSRWTGALERALVEREIDIAVHSAKDVPGVLAPNTAIAAVPPRLDPRDVLIGASAIEALPEGARIGTSALRRRAQLLSLRPDLEVVELRGNVDTRLRLLAEREVDALVLAAAGLIRLAGADTLPSHDALGPPGSYVPPGCPKDLTALGHPGILMGPIDAEIAVPAPGQGSIVIQTRSEDAEVLTARIDDPASHAALSAERQVAARLGASCETAVGVWATPVSLTAFVGLPDGSEWLLDSIDEPDADALASRLLAAGAAELLARAGAMVAR